MTEHEPKDTSERNIAFPRFSPRFAAAIAELPGAGQLRRVGQRPNLARYLADIWARRLFIVASARGAAGATHSDDRLGQLWLVLRPLLDAVFYYLIFGLLLNVTRGMDNFIAWLLVGLFTFQYTSRLIGSGASLIKSSKAMIRAFAFPRATLAFSAVLRELLLAVPSFVVLVVLIIAIPPHVQPTTLWLLALPILALQVVMTLGIVLLFARIGSAWADFTRLMSFVTRVLMYGSGVIFPLVGRISDPVVLSVVTANPFYIMLDMYRSVLVYGELPALETWLYFGAWSLGSLIVGLVAFWSAEEEYGRE